MATVTPTPPPAETRTDTEASRELRDVDVSGQLHAFDRDYALVLPGGLRVAHNIASILFFLVFAALWLIFGALLIVNQGALDTVWKHLLDLPLILQVVAWILFLPITIGLWIWESDLALWLRLAALLVVAVGWTAVMFPRAGSDREKLPDAGPGFHQIPPDRHTQ
jgi:hypothetical protein